jgi:predicted small lipoprotein YifL
MQTVKIILLILICAALLSACGLRGPLYLPDENPVAKPAVEQDSTVGTDEEENKDDEENDKKKEIISA